MSTMWTPDIREKVVQQLRPYMSDADAEKAASAVEKVLERGGIPSSLVSRP